MDGGDDQGASGGGTNRAQSRWTAARQAPNARCAWRVAACPSPARWPEPTATTPSFLEETLQSFARKKPAPTTAKPPHVLLNKGRAATTRPCAPASKPTACSPASRARGEAAAAKQKQPGKKARRRVVERTHSWFCRFRRILTRWCKKERNCLGTLCFVCGLVSYRAAGLFG